MHSGWRKSDGTRGKLGEISKNLKVSLAKSARSIEIDQTGTGEMAPEADYCPSFLVIGENSRECMTLKTIDHLHIPVDRRFGRASSLRIGPNGVRISR